VRKVSRPISLGRLPWSPGLLEISLSRKATDFVGAEIDHESALLSLIISCLIIVANIDILIVLLLLSCHGSRYFIINNQITVIINKYLGPTNNRIIFT
jgi:hypothetical protein